MQRNTPGVGTGWEPYPTSLRIVNWIKWALAGNVLPETCVHSLAVQARWLTKRLEVYLLGNHLFVNAKALVFAGLFFDGPEADAWLARGLVILAREVPEQILADGGHFERSTMYHALALEDMLDLCNIARCYAAAPGVDDASCLSAWQSRVPSMMAWLHTMCHPDAGIGFFNDAAFGIAPDRDELDAYAARLQFSANYPHGSDVQWLNASGYARISSGDATALLDLAPIGPDYLPGHAHADTLSFELSLGLQRVLVNSGTSCYGVNSERLRQRGTAAHNTVTVDGQDSSEVWGGFRVARRARPSQPVWDTSSGIQVRCTHDGYTRLPGKPLHERRWRLEGNRIQVIDYVSGTHGYAEARFYFYPGLVLTTTDNALQGVARLADGREVKWAVTIGDARLEQSTWHPRFGVKKANRCLIVRLTAGHSKVEFNWKPVAPRGERCNK